MMVTVDRRTVLELLLELLLALLLAATSSTCRSTDAHAPSCVDTCNSAALTCSALCSATGPAPAAYQNYLDCVSGACGGPCAEDDGCPMLSSDCQGCIATSCTQQFLSCQSQ